MVLALLPIYLRAESQDNTQIKKLIHTVADNGVATLMLKRAEIKKMGREVSHIPLLTILDFAITDPETGPKIKKIYKNPLKRALLKTGGRPQLMRLSKRKGAKENLLQFCTKHGLNPHNTENALENGDWDLLLKPLLSH